MSGSSSLSEDSLMALLEISSRFTYNWLPRNAIPHAELVSHFYVDVEGFAFNTWLLCSEVGCQPKGPSHTTQSSYGNDLRGLTIRSAASAISHSATYSNNCDLIYLNLEIGRVAAYWIIVAPDPSDREPRRSM